MTLVDRSRECEKTLAGQSCPCGDCVYWSCCADFLNLNFEIEKQGGV